MGLWTKQEDDLLEVLRPVLSTKEIADVFNRLAYNRSTEAVRKRSKKLGIHFMDHGQPAASELNKEEIKAVQIVLSERLDAIEAVELPTPLTSSQKGALTSAKRTFQSSLCDQLREIRTSTPRYGSVSTAKETLDTTLCVLISDTHFGELIEDSDGRVLFNMDIAERRMLSIPNTVLSVLDTSEINEIVIFLAGDHIDGEGIFPAQAMEIQTHATQQILRATKAIWQMILLFREALPDALIRVVTCRGNHGRTGKDVSPEANWDNIIFQQIELLVDMQEDSRLTIKNRYGEYNTCLIKGWKFYARHICPVQADTAGGRARFGGWADIHGYDAIVYGHFHHWGVFTYQDKPLFRNGSLGGSNAYSEGFGAGDGPAQLAFTVTENDLPQKIIPIKFD